jgi:hypothetical protein
MSVVARMFEPEGDLMSTTLIAPNAPSITPRITTSRERLIRAAEGLWRVQETKTGRVLGHLRVVADPRGLRYRAERLHLDTGRFRVIGEFWRADEAVSVLRYS